MATDGEMSSSILVVADCIRIVLEVAVWAGITAVADTNEGVPILEALAFGILFSIND